MSIGFVIEGDLDILVISHSISSLPSASSVEVKYYPVGGRKTGEEIRRGCWALLQQGCDYIMVLQDRNSREECAPSIARRILGELSRHQLPTERIKVCIIEQEIESWILADAQCVRTVTRMQFHPERTEELADAREKLRKLLEEAFPAAYRVTPPTNRECITKFINYFDLARASEYNRSARRFFEKCREVICNLSDT